MIWKTRPRSEGAGALAFVTQGSGPALVLVHGVGLQSEAWNAVMPALAAQHTVYAVDMPGHGKSPLNGAATLADFSDRVAAFVSSLPGSVRIAGHSMGAMIALELAHRAPQKIAGVAAFNAIFQRTPEAAQAVQARAAALDKAQLPDQGPTVQRWFGAAPEGALKDARDACADWLTSADPQGYATAYNIFAQHDGPSVVQLANLTAPALFMTATGDLNSTPEMTHKMASHAPLGQMKVVDGAAHMMPMTHAEIVSAAMLKTFGTAT